MTLKRAILAVALSFALLAAASAGWPQSATATPTASFQNISYNAGTNTLTWQLVLTNDATPVANATVTSSAPAGATATSTTGTGSCTGLPSATPLTCSIPAGGSLTINYSRTVQAICNPQTITLGPVTITGGGVVGTVTVPRTLANVAAVSICSTGPTTTASYNVANQTIDWVIPTFASPNGQTTYQFISGSSDRNCPFIVTFAPATCSTGAAPVFTDVTSRITAATPAGICGTLPATLNSATLYTCTIPTGSPAGSITISLSMPQQCSEYVGALPAYSYQQPGGVFTILLGGYVAVPANLSLCPVVVVPPVTQPAVPTATPVPAAPTATPVVVALPAIPQVFQNPVAQGIFNGPRSNTPTPVRPREVGTAGSTGVGLDPGAVLLRPPSTGDAGLLRLRMLRLNAW